MTLIAEFTVREKVGMIKALSEAPAVRFEVERTMPDGDTVIFFFWAVGGSSSEYDAIEAGLPDEDETFDWTVVEDHGDQRLYRVDIDEDEIVGLHDLDREFGALQLSMTAHVDGADVRVRFPDREAMLGYFQRVRETGQSVSLTRLYRSDEGDADGLGLSAKQRAALTSALEMGYYEVPQAAALTDVAEELGISRQAASERLRRGTAALVRDTVGDSTKDGGGADRPTSDAP
ncbi:MAG: helix-turn-helix domain-containing protein [Halolamina sp.]